MSPACPTCETRLLACAADDTGPEEPTWSQEAMWCPRCAGRWIIERCPGLPGSAPKTPLVIPTIYPMRIDRPAYEARVARDGSVLFSFGGAPPVTMSPAYAMRIAKATLHIAYEAGKEQHHLRGADRWLATKHPTQAGALHVTHDDKTATFVRVNVRREHRCAGCGQKSAGPVMWQEEEPKRERAGEYREWIHGAGARLCADCATPVERGIVRAVAR